MSRSGSGRVGSDLVWSGLVWSGLVGSGRVGSAGDTLRPGRRRGRTPTRSVRKRERMSSASVAPVRQYLSAPYTLTRKKYVRFLLHHSSSPGWKNVYIYIHRRIDTHKRRAREAPRRMRIRVLGSRDGPRVQETIGCAVGREGRLFTHREAIEGSGRGAAMLRAGGGGQ